MLIKQQQSWLYNRAEYIYNNRLNIGRANIEDDKIWFTEQDTVVSNNDDIM